MLEVKPMDASYLPPTCLHKGPIDPAAHRDVCKVGEDGVPPHPWADAVLVELAQRHGDLTCQPWKPANHEFYREMTQRYGACQMLAWEDGRVVGMLPFFPLPVMQLLDRVRGEEVAGPAYGVHSAEEAARSLMVRCVMTARPYFGGQASASRAFIGNNPSNTPQEAGARRGVGQKLVQGLIEWARAHGWKRILANAHADIDYCYGVYGCGGKSFWQKAGFRVAGQERQPTPENEQWRSIVETQAREKGMSVDEAWTWYKMVYEI